MDLYTRVYQLVMAASPSKTVPQAMRAWIHNMATSWIRWGPGVRRRNVDRHHSVPRLLVGELRLNSDLFPRNTRDLEPCMGKNILHIFSKYLEGTFLELETKKLSLRLNVTQHG